MDRLLNIERQGGFPLCAETLKVLDENGRMLEGMLKRIIPVDMNQAVDFGDYLVVGLAGKRKKVVKKGTVSATSYSQCKVVLNETLKNVEDSNGNTYANVWAEETADIVDETDPEAQWTILSPWDVFESRLYNNLLPDFEAGLSGVSVTNGETVTIPILKNNYRNVVCANSDRLRLKFAIGAKICAKATSFISIPIPVEIPEWVRMEADIENATNTTHYAAPAHAYTINGKLMVCIGLWMQQNNLVSGLDDSLTFNVWIYVNKEVLL